MAQQYPGADFVTVYIAEAHASDEWTLRDKENAADGGRWDVQVARTLEQRLATARDWVRWLDAQQGGAGTAYYCDLMDDNARTAYGAWPERLVVVEGGAVRYYGEQGPWGYQPDELRRWLARRFAAQPRAAAV